MDFSNSIYKYIYKYIYMYKLYRVFVLQINGCEWVDEISIYSRVGGHTRKLYPGRLNQMNHEKLMCQGW